MSVNCHWVDEDWAFRKILLDVCPIAAPCEIDAALLKILRSYSIPTERILCCTYDYGRHGRHAKDDFNYIPCAVHSWNSMMIHAFDLTKAGPSKITEFVILMNNCPAVLADFLEFAATAHGEEGSWEFPLDVSARLGSVYQLIDISIKAGKAMEDTLRRYEPQLGATLLLTPQEQDDMKILSAFMEYFEEDINDICAAEVLTVGSCLHFSDKIMVKIMGLVETCRDDNNFPDWIAAVLDKMFMEANNYKLNMRNNLARMTAILDPRIIPENLKLEEEARLLLFKYQTSSDGALDSDLFKEEINHYLSIERPPLRSHPSQWWKDNGARFPTLSMMAWDYLAVQASSIPPSHVLTFSSS